MFMPVVFVEYIIWIMRLFSSDMKVYSARMDILNRKGRTVIIRPTGIRKRFIAFKSYINPVEDHEMESEVDR